MWERKKYWQEVGYGALNQGSDWSGFQMPSHPSAQFYLLQKPKPENFFAEDMEQLGSNLARVSPERGREVKLKEACKW